MASMALRTLGASLLAMALVAGQLSTAEASGPRWTPTPGTPRKVALGVSMKPDADTATYDQAIAAFDGYAPAIWSIWSDWGGGNSAFPDVGLLEQLRANGTVPMIFWQPVDPADVKSNRYRYKRIMAGDYDAYIRQFAQAARDWGGRVIIRFAHEMDGKWFPWGVTRFNNTRARFIKAWIHIWNIFKDPLIGVGATEVKFAWTPYSTGMGKGSLYPGDAYVDYVGFTGFNWGPPRGWRSMMDAYARNVAGLAAFTKKPIIVAETGSSPEGGDKGAWISEGYPAVYAAYPRIKAIVYFNIDQSHVGQPNWLLTTTPEALAAYKAILAQVPFQGRIK